MRPLTDEERKFTKKGLEKVGNELDEALDELIVAQKTKIINMQQRDFEDAVREPTRRRRDREDKIALKFLDAKVDQKKQVFETMEGQLKNGVEEKKS